MLVFRKFVLGFFFSSTGGWSLGYGFLWREGVVSIGTI